MDRKIASTPCKNFKGRESLGFIKCNTVAKMINAFEQPKKSPNKSPGQDSTIFKNMSPITEVSSLTMGDSAVGSSSPYRSRSKSISNSTSTVQSSARTLEAYANFPNFKFKQLKYFGVDPRNYLRQLNVDEETIDRLLQCDIDRAMRQRSKTVSGRPSQGRASYGEWMPERVVKPSMVLGQSVESNGGSSGYGGSSADSYHVGKLFDYVESKCRF